MIFDHVKEVFIAQHRVDFRLGVFGMKAEMAKLELDPYAGDCCVFINPSHRQIRVVGASSTGCFLIIKVLEAGALRKKMRFLQDPSFVEISKLELALLLEGASVSRVESVPDWVACKNKHSNVTTFSDENTSQRSFTRAPYASPEMA